MLSGILLLSLVAHQSLAQENSIQISVHQSSSFENLLGQWTLAKPNNQTQVSSRELETIPSLVPGLYSIFVVPPEGAVTRMILTKNGEQIETVDRPQISFTLTGQDTASVEIRYTFLRLGDAIVNSEPQGLKFTLKGPNRTAFRGTTPAFYAQLPVGQYSVAYDQIPDCIFPPPQSDLIVEKGRAEFFLTLKCTGAEALKKKQSQSTQLDHVSIQLDGRQLAFSDVPKDAWFAPFVAIAAEKEVLTGSRTADGSFTGLFLPGNRITLAELAKIAHKLANTDETKVRGEPLNPLARNAWFSPYFASAEYNGWMVFAEPNVAPHRLATRAEVVTTILQAFNVPLQWPTGRMFHDVSVLEPHSAAIETAVREGLIEGYPAKDGQSLKQFGPRGTMTRAEICKVIVNALRLYVETKSDAQNQE